METKEDQVLGIFGKIQENESINNKFILQLVEEYGKDSIGVRHGLEQGFLRVMKTMIDTKKRIVKFDKFSEKFFSALHSAANGEKKGGKSSASRTKLEKEDVDELFEYFLQFFGEGLLSSNTHVKTFCALQMVGMLKLLSQDDLSNFDRDVLETIESGCINLIEAKNKSLQLQGLTIAHYIQNLDLPDIGEELLRCLATDEKQEVRLAALRIVSLEEDCFDSNFPEMIHRTRDISSLNRAYLYKRLTGSRILLANLATKEVYKLIYDGLGSRETGVRDACIDYLKMNYQEILKCDEAPMEEMPPHRRIRLEILRYFKVFQIERTLRYPLLRRYMEDMTIIFITNIISPADIVTYTEALLKTLNSKEIGRVEPEEIYLLRIMANHIKEDKSNEQLVNVIDDRFPSGIDFADIVAECHKKKNLLALSEILRLAELLYNCDEVGRQKLKEVLREILLDIDTEPPKDTDPYEEETEYNDIFRKFDDESFLRFRLCSTEYYDTIIDRKDDLVPLIVDIIKKIVGASKSYVFSVYVLEIISLVQVPIPFNKTGEIGSQEEDLLKKQDLLTSEKKRLIEELESLDQEIADIKKKPRRNIQDELYPVESRKNKASRELKTVEEALAIVDKQVERVALRCLNMTAALLQHCRFGQAVATGVNNLMSKLITPCFQRGTEEVRMTALKCLALFVLLDRKFSLNFLQVFVQNLEEPFDNEATKDSVMSFIAGPFQLISLKALFDFALVHDIFKSEALPNAEEKENGRRQEEGNSSDEEEDPDEEIAKTITYEDVGPVLSRYLFHADVSTRTLVVEGFSKLIFNGKLANPLQNLVYLMVIWRDANIIKQGGFEAIQVLSVLFKQYKSVSLISMETLERALEVYIQILLSLSDDRGFEFNRELLMYDSGESLLVNMTSVAIRLLSYKENEAIISQILTEKMSSIGPSERFFLFLCRLSNGKTCAAAKKMRGIFEKTITYFDFIPKADRLALLACSLALEEAIAASDDGKKTLSKFLREMKERLVEPGQSKKSTAVQEENRSVLSLLREGESGEIKCIKDTVETDIQATKMEFATIFKELKTLRVIVRKDGAAEDPVGEGEILFDYEFDKPQVAGDDDDEDKENDVEEFDRSVRGSERKRGPKVSKRRDSPPKTNKRGRPRKNETPVQTKRPKAGKK
eukprot:TRINITY_DN1973_c0_g1_i2.p1 TRINITY_DN1973_c0_g1~~TRINITY_DN1973_c0_g1_i2.p1  ORF type:complete len:1162 (+),score=349.37 TRINITY_DN1973_c0_g1_i2:124-3609(+)